jgi:hypothetical protein
MSPHSLEFVHRKSVLVAVTAIAVAVGILAPAQNLGMRFAAPFMAMFALGGGYLVGWLPLQFQAVIWGSVAAGFLRALCLFFFYLFLVASVGNAAMVPSIAEELRADGITVGMYIALYVPGCLGAAAGAHRVYSSLLPPNTSFERTREG